MKIELISGRGAAQVKLTRSVESMGESRNTSVSENNLFNTRLIGSKVYTIFSKVF